MAVLVMLAWVVAPAAPEAGADGVAPLLFQGTTSLPEFPCPLPQPPDPVCVGSMAGSVSGELAGTHFGRPWTLTLAGASLMATFAYTDTCVEGFASGTASVVADLGEVSGTYDDGGTLPRPIVGATVEAAWQWTRTGATLRIAPVTDVSVVLEVAGLGPREVLSDGVGAGAASFVPDFDEEDLPDCVGQSNRPAVSVEVTGSVVLADAL